MVIATIFHELVHHLSKVVHGPLVITSGVGYYPLVSAKAGEKFEVSLIAGIVVALWNSKDLGEMEKIRGLVLEYPEYDGNTWVLSK